MRLPLLPEDVEGLVVGEVEPVVRLRLEGDAADW